MHLSFISSVNLGKVRIFISDNSFEMTLSARIAILLVFFSQEWCQYIALFVCNISVLWKFCVVSLIRSSLLDLFMSMSLIQLIIPFSVLKCRFQIAFFYTKQCYHGLDGWEKIKISITSELVCLLFDLPL